MKAKLPKLTKNDTASSSSIAIAEPETLWCVCFQDYQGDKEDSD